MGNGVSSGYCGGADGGCPKETKEDPPAAAVPVLGIGGGGLVQAALCVLPVEI